MSRCAPPGPVLALLAWLAAAACATPPPRFPFPESAAFHAAVAQGKWIVNEFVSEADATSVEVVIDEPGSGGWAIELGARYATGEDDGLRRVFDPALGPPTNATRVLLVDSERESDFYELTIGARQTYFPGSAVQPYFAVGGALQQTRTRETFVQPAIPPSIPADTPQVDHERSEIRPALYMRTGLAWNVLRDQVRADTEFPLALDVRGQIGLEYSTLEVSLSLGFGR